MAIGLASVVMQLVLVREFLAQFQGNEFTIALIFFSWLILGGMGAWLALFAIRRRPAVLTRLSLLSLLLAALAAMEILAIRTLRDIIFLHGAEVGFYPTMAAIFGLTAPYGILNGFLVPYSLYVLRNQQTDYPGARIYMQDNVGDIMGGVLFSFVLVLWLTPLQSVFAANLPLLAAAFLLIPAGQRVRPAFLLALAGSVAMLLAGLLLEKQSLTPFEGRLIHYEESRYGRITVHQDRELLTIFVDGAPIFSNQNVSQDEETIHFPLSQIDDPRAVLLIGVEGGMLQEAAKYRPDQVDYLEIDRRLTDVQLRYKLLEPLPGLHIIHQDGRAFLAKTDRLYDAIIINLPEPDTFQINRFFTGEFFRLARQHLQPDGIFAFSVAGFDNYLSEPARLKISSLFNTARLHFQHVLSLPGNKVYFLCGNRPLNPDIPALLNNRGINTTFISSFFSGNITPERLQYLRDNLRDDTPVNLDTSPFLLRIMFQQWFARFATSPLPFIVAGFMLLAIYLCRCRREELVLFSTGFVIMGSETLVIFIYQILFGYVYEQIGLLVTVFLAGLLPGAWLGEQLRRRRNFKKTLALCDTFLILLLAFLLLALTSAHDQLQPVFFLLFGFTVSLLCGCQFPLALTLGGGDNPAAARTFSSDLIGAACGTLITSLLFIPFLGILWATAGLVLIKVFGMCALAPLLLPDAAGNDSQSGPR
jgi:spermidine synthase